MSSLRFETLEDEVRSVLESRVPPTPQQAATVASLLADMETELQMAPPSYRLQMVERVREYRRRLRTAAAASPAGDETRRTVERGLQTLQRTSDSIARSQQVSAETDAVGAEVISELGTQRESLQRTRDRLEDTDAELSRSQRLLRTMYVRVLTNRVLLAAIIAVELALLGAAVYLKFFKK
ncbi:Vesicle transport through interaction with t-SNAREs 1B [Amphibalanus amphitrite]|uniref:Vesicle transport through interaction with t-SNAREs 1B n=1 Tax=Amphibalanus amphitrite TaxID=1232801 RepID=A0A6A4X3C3_AMPAM|nr:vesicle transport through interaction with t-SNAREs homolog 1B-like [Amphibalanus amphitrite]XP_043223347.1 vesicle transport through interaction with t-SNAREs homolog 1B-like [Amphibalanus amphitrite]XP_043223348.1 vesicle transport through interaction with t-SNAREs homolog 1B-like [Amphibalanus amphitrite]KAF0313765.1 Vesicle transport through interaction with t-SNAREs 1B [Amphibalanus amphitrite]